MGIIYKITSPSDKVYVGQTTQTFKERIKNHKKPSSNCTLLKRALDKYGDEMTYEIIEEVPIDQLDEREIYWIKELNSLAPNGYNCSSGGNDKKILSQVLKNNIRDGINETRIKNNGRVGSVYKSPGGYKPRICLNGIVKYISNGIYKTKEEANEILKQYTRDPENFVKPNAPIQINRRPKGSGSVYFIKSRNRWGVEFNRTKLGRFKTKEEAECILENYKRSQISN